MQRLFYDAYAMGLIDGITPGTSQSVREGNLELISPSQRFQAVLGGIDGNLDGFCRASPEGTLDGMMDAMAAFILDDAERIRCRGGPKGRRMNAGYSP